MIEHWGAGHSITNSGGGKENAMQSNAQIILKVIFFVTLPMGVLIFLFGSVVPKQMGIEKEPWNTMSTVAPIFILMIGSLAGGFYAMKLARKNAVDEQHSDVDGE